MLDNTIKAISENEDEIRVGNYLVLWGDENRRDLTGIFYGKNPDGSGGEFFTPATDFESEFTKAGRLAVDWEHRRDQEVGDMVLGFVDWGSAKSDEHGLWVERVLDRRNRYVQMLEGLIRSGLVGSSSEAAGEVVKAENGEIRRWPLYRDSLTVTPMEWRMLTENQITALKAVAGDLPGVSELLPEEEQKSTSVTDGEIVEVEEPQEAEESATVVKAATGDPVSSDKQPFIEKAHVRAKEDYEMSDEIKNAGTEDNGLGERLSLLENQMDNLSKGLDTILEAIQNEPTVRKAGYFTEDGGKADQKVKSFADWLLAIKRNDTVRLNTVYGSAKALNEGSGAEGGYLVPTEYQQRLLEVGVSQSPILQMVQPIPVSSDAGEWPALDQYTAPTAGIGDTAFAAGVVARKVQEAGSLNQTEPEFEMIRWRLGDIGGYTQITANLASDSPFAVEALLTRLFGVAVASKKEYYILRGNGVGEPLGILNAPAALGITPDSNGVFAYADAVEMVSRFKKITNSAKWVMHQSMYPDLAGSSWVLGHNIMKLSDMGFGEGLLSEHLPVADQSGCVVLADFGAYLLFEKGGLEIAYSEHVGFTNRLGTWRFYTRLDGQPWVKGQITLADPSGTFTVSPFVYFND